MEGRGWGMGRGAHQGEGVKGRGLVAATWRIRERDATSMVEHFFVSIKAKALRSSFGMD